MKRVILTGGSGFVGANLARRLLADGHELHLLLRPEYSDWRVRDILDDVSEHQVDLRDDERLSTAVRDIRPEWIFHLATYGAYPSQTDTHRMVQTNLFGTMNLVNACARIGFDALVNTGSSSEYGLKNHAPSEDEVLQPNSAYAVTKAAASRFCQDLSAAQNRNITTLRLYSVYGPYEEPSRLIPTLIANGLRGELPPMASPETARDFIFVDDVVDVYLLAASTQSQGPGAIYNIGSGKQTNLREAVEIARRVLNLEVAPKWESLPARSWDTDVWVAENSKFAKQFGWQPRYDFEKGFRATVDWFRNNPSLAARYLGQT